MIQATAPLSVAHKFVWFGASKTCLVSPIRYCHYSSLLPCSFHMPQTYLLVSYRWIAMRQGPQIVLPVLRCTPDCLGQVVLIPTPIPRSYFKCNHRGRNGWNYFDQGLYCHCYLYICLVECFWYSDLSIVTIVVILYMSSEQTNGIQSYERFIKVFLVRAIQDGNND